MASLYNKRNSYHTDRSFVFLKQENHNLLEPGKSNIVKLGIILVMVSICGCQSTELDMQPKKTNELEMKIIEAIPEVAPPQNPCPISQVPVVRQAPNNFPTPSQVEKEIKEIQEKAFEFAVATAQGVPNKKERRARSIVMDRRLTELYPLIPCLESKQALAITWSNARLDIGYVLSDGKDLASPGLYVYVQTLRKENKEKKDNQ